MIVFAIHDSSVSAAVGLEASAGEFGSVQLNERALPRLEHDRSRVLRARAVLRNKLTHAREYEPT